MTPDALADADDIIVALLSSGDGTAGEPMTPGATGDGAEEGPGGGVLRTSSVIERGVPGLLTSGVPGLLTCGVPRPDDEPDSARLSSSIGVLIIQLIEIIVNNHTKVIKILTITGS